MNEFTTRTHIDLFSGIGGFALAARWAGVETVAFCEIEKYAQRVLRKNFPGVRILEDVRSFPAAQFRQPWLITGGYPCQPFSQAGKRRGTEDDRHLWPEMFRIIRSSRPVWVLCENVAGHITMGLDEVISDLEGEEYSVQSFVIPALSVDAKHRRDRVWIVGHSSSITINLSKNSDTCERSKKTASKGLQESRDSGSRITFPNSNSRRCQECESKTKSLPDPHMESEPDGRLWLPEPDLDRVAHGVSNRVDRIKGLGNAIVPQVAYQIIRTMIEAEEQFIGEQHENQP